MLGTGPRFDVIVSDVMMPEMTGPELYARSCVRSPDMADRFIFASGDPMTARRLVASAASYVGAVRTPPLLPKPIWKAALVSAVIAAGSCNSSESGTYPALGRQRAEHRVRKNRG
jgi:CheY-like chemotaxis protein